MENQQFLNLDEYESAFFAREVEFIKAKTYDVKYPNLKAIQMIPVSTEAGPGAKVITYQQFNMVGIAKIIANYADDLPRADVFGKEFSSKVKSIGNSFGYNIQEIREANLAGVPLSAKKGTAARKANEQAVNRIGWFGDATSGLLGFLNQPNVPAAAVPVGTTSGNQNWIGATPKLPAEILQDMNDAVTRIIDLTLGVERPNTMLLPVQQHRKISTTRLDSGTDTTIREYFLKNNPEIQMIDWVNELKDVSPNPAGGGGPVDVMATYDRSPEVLTYEIPQPFEMFPAQERGLEFLVPAHSRNGGVVVYYPLAIDLAVDI